MGQGIDAIQAVMEARGMEPGRAIDQARHLVDEEWVPRSGARMVAKAWTSSAYRQWLLADGKAAAELGFGMPPHHRYLMALENMPHLQQGDEAATGRAEADEEQVAIN